VIFKPNPEGQNNEVIAKVTDPQGNESLEDNDESVTDLLGANEITAASIKLEDKLNDETQDAKTYYPNQDETPYVGDVASGNGDTAIDLATGLTNDTTPTLSFSLDNPLDANQTVEVIRYTIVNGTRAIADDVTAKLSTTDNKAFTLKDGELEQTYGTDYQYEIVLKTDDDVINTQTYDFRSDTIVEALEVVSTNFISSSNATDGTIVFKATEPNSKVTAKYTVGGVEQNPELTPNADGTYTLEVQGFNRYDPSGIVLTVIDAAGNINTQKVNFIRNLFTELSATRGPNTNVPDAYDDPLVTWTTPDQGRNTADAAGGGLVSTAGNDSLIIGLGDADDMGVGNGSIGDALTYGAPNAAPFSIDMGAGDDFVQVRGTAQNTNNGLINMGDGNDKLTFNQNISFGAFVINMGQGHDLVEVLGNTGIAQASTTTITFSDNNDTMFVAVNYDGTKNLDFGSGNNQLHVGGNLNGSGKVEFGNDNDIIYIGGTLGSALDFGNHNIINTSGGDDYLEVNGLSYRGLVNMGEGDDKVVLKGGIYDDSAHDVHQYNGGTNADGSEENDVLVLGREDAYHSLFFQNFETIDLTSAAIQTVTLTIDSLLRDDTQATYIKGGSEDIIKLGTENNNLNDSLNGSDVVWSKVDAEQKEVDGITYNAYTVTNTTEWVYIQDSITEII
ncbi:hypothetical protein ACLRAI_01990, partial [[Pasteurella] aerogenes]